MNMRLKKPIKLHNVISFEQWRTHGGEGVSGVNPPPLKIVKEMKTSLFGTHRLFHTEIAEIALAFFCAIQLAYKILKNFHCDAIIGLLIVKLCSCAALDVGDSEKVKLLLFLR